MTETIINRHTRYKECIVCFTGAENTCINSLVSGSGPGDGLSTLSYRGQR